MRCTCKSRLSLIKKNWEKNGKIEAKHLRNTKQKLAKQFSFDKINSYQHRKIHSNHPLLTSTERHAKTLCHENLIV